MKLLGVVLLLLSPVVAWSQKAAQQDYNPDTIQVLYFDNHGPKPYPPSARFPYQRVAIRTTIQANGVYEDRLVDIGLQQLRFTVRHEPAPGKALLTMFYADGHPRVRAQYLEDTTAAPPTEYLVPSLRRPLSAHALLDGELTTFYPSGQVRQRALYRRGQRVQSQCFDLKNRPVSCNDKQLLITAGLPASVYAGKKVAYNALIINSIKSCVTKHEAVFNVGPQGELYKLQVQLSARKTDDKTARLVRQHAQLLLDFVLDAQATNIDGTHIDSGTYNDYLSNLALSASSLFGQKGSMRPALLDGEPVTTYFRLPVHFGLGH